MRTVTPADVGEPGSGRLLFSLLFLIVFLLPGCRTLYHPAGTGEFPFSGDFSPGWQPVDDGLDFFSFRDVKTPLAVYALRVDLDSGIWELVFTEPVDGVVPGVDGYPVPGIRTSRFLMEEECRAAVNGGPFSPYRWFFSGRGQMPAGIYIWKGSVITGPIEWFDALAVDPDGGLSIRSQDEYPFKAEYVLGGFQRLLESGEVAVSEGGPKDARTAVGLSRAGRFLYLMTADGRRSKYSLGLTLAEAARLLRLLGAWDGLNMDGGGSTVMVFGEPEPDGNGVIPQIVNRPVNLRGFPERIVATHLGLRKIK